jgi:3-deoxy-manno-octulosonate cytidylyltransferase (CMP-KDO synthetase)
VAESGSSGALSQRSSRASVVIVLPARYQSSRFPGKPLARLGEKTLLQQVYDRLGDVKGVERVIVATDDARIEEAVKKFGGDVIMTGGDLRTGSDRVAAVARSVPADVYVNFQADEIPLGAGFLEDLLIPFAGSEAEVGTLKHAIHDERELADPNVVKVVTDSEGYALYFSRSPIPYIREKGTGSKPSPFHWKHPGVYAFTRAALFQFAGLPTGILEASEQLEQLRLLEAGIRIRVWETKQSSLRIDTPSDLDRAGEFLTGKEARPTGKEPAPQARGGRV